MQQNNSEYITVRQLATLLGTTVTAIRTAMYKGYLNGLHTYRIGKGKIFFKRSEIYSWLEQNSKRIQK